MTYLRPILMMLLLCGIMHPASAQADILELQGYDRILGDEGAPVTMIEYSSLSCPHCAAFHNEILPTLKERYIDTGKVRLVVRNFPGNAPALHASMLTMCVEPSKYYTFLKVLFSSQKQWAMSYDYKERLKTITQLGGVSGEAFTACIEDEELEKKVLMIRQEANDHLKIEATPTFYINGEPLKGAASVEEFAKVIDAKLVQIEGGVE